MSLLPHPGDGCLHVFSPLAARSADGVRWAAAQAVGAAPSRHDEAVDGPPALAAARQEAARHTGRLAHPGGQGPPRQLVRRVSTAPARSLLPPVRLQSRATRPVVWR